MRNDITGMTDIMQTVSVLRSAKNFFFFISLLSLLTLGGIFVLSRAGMISYPWEDAVKRCDKNNAYCNDNHGIKPLSALAAVIDNNQPQENAQDDNNADNEELADDNDQKAVDNEQVKDSAKIEEQIEDAEGIEQRAAEAVADAVVEELPDEHIEEVADPKPDKAEPVKQSRFRIAEFSLRWSTAAAIIKLCNAITAFSLLVYSLTLLICVKITIVGRLSGAAHITTAMYLSMIAAVLFMPWQAAFPAVGLYGAMFLPYEFASSIIDYDQMQYCNKVLFYLRYAGLWLFVFMLLLMAQGRSMCWLRGFSRKSE